MAHFGKRKARPKPVMNVTPLVDVVLVLLIIFMVVIPMMEKSAEVDLTSIFNVDPDRQEAAEPFTLSLTADGTTFLEEEEVPVEAMEARLREANEREPERKIVLRADRTAHYSDARRLFKMCQDLGFPGISMRVNERAGGAAASTKQESASAAGRPHAERLAVTE